MHYDRNEEKQEREKQYRQIAMANSMNRHILLTHSLLKNCDESQQMLLWFTLAGLYHTVSEKNGRIISDCDNRTNLYDYLSKAWLISTDFFSFSELNGTRDILRAHAYTWIVFFVVAETDWRYCFDFAINWEFKRLVNGGQEERIRPPYDNWTINGSWNVYVCVCVAIHLLSFTYIYASPFCQLATDSITLSCCLTKGKTPSQFGLVAFYNNNKSFLFAMA